MIISIVMVVIIFFETILVLSLFDTLKAYERDNKKLIKLLKDQNKDVLPLIDTYRKWKRYERKSINSISKINLLA